MVSSADGAAISRKSTSSTGTHSSTPLASSQSKNSMTSSISLPQKRTKMPDSRQLIYNSAWLTLQKLRMNRLPRLSSRWLPGEWSKRKRQVKDARNWAWSIRSWVRRLPSWVCSSKRTRRQVSFIQALSNSRKKPSRCKRRKTNRPSTSLPKWPLIKTWAIQVSKIIKCNHVSPRLEGKCKATTIVQLTSRLKI